MWISGVWRWHYDPRTIWTGSSILEQKGKDSDAKFKEELKATIKEIIDDLGLATKEDLEKLKEDLK